MKLPIADITPFTMLDYPDHTACIIWFAGCNFRCAYCHNPELIAGKKTKYAIEKVWKFLNSRAGLLDAVVMSGGECTLSPDFPEFVQMVKSLGFKTKIDTNGSQPDRLENLLARQCVDYVALDYKAPLHKLPEITGWYLTDAFEHSLDLLCNSNVELEIRTTVHSDLLDENDLVQIMRDLERRGFAGNFFIQNYRDGETLGKLPKQTQTIATQSLAKQQTFPVAFRNF